MSRWIPRLLTALLALVMLGGCVSYYERHYGGSGVYYGGGYDDYAYRQPVYRSVNPVYYPYWSLDYFYFSQYRHPYSFYVGYAEPLYYPYPGWALDYHYYSPRYRHYRGTVGFGYPWYGSGHGYPNYSLGFFASWDRHGGYYRDRHRADHRIRRIDRRLRALQEPVRQASRRELLARDRAATRRDPTPRDSYRDSNEIRGSAYVGRTLSRRSVLQGRSDPRAGGADLRNSRDPRRAEGTGARADRDTRSRREWLREPRTDRPVRDDGGRADRGSVVRDRRDIQRAPPVRNAGGFDGRRDGRHDSGADGGRRAILRDSGRARPPRSTPPPAARVPDPPSRRSAPRSEPRSRPSPPPRTRSVEPPRRSSRGPSRRDLLRDRDGRGGRDRRRDRH